MRSFLAAALLAVTPVVANAQAMHSGISHLVAAVDAPGFAFQAGALNAAAPRVFSGLITPIRQTQFMLNGSLPAQHPSEVTVTYDVNAAGTPENVKVLTPADAVTTQRVVEAVSRMRYTAGRLDGQAVSVPVTLHVSIR